MDSLELAAGAERVIDASALQPSLFHEGDTGSAL
jgi:hypothetical protein